MNGPGRFGVRQTQEQIQRGQSRSQHQYISGLRQFAASFVGPRINQVAIALVKRAILERWIARRKITKRENHLIGNKRRSSGEFDAKRAIKERHEVDRFGSNFLQSRCNGFCLRQQVLEIFSEKHSRRKSIWMEYGYADRSQALGSTLQPAIEPADIIRKSAHCC